MKKILIMGLPGSGKTTLAQQLSLDLAFDRKTIDWFNADDVRKQFDDWDFSHQGRIRQATRMAELSEHSTADYVIVDFVAPLKEMRDIFRADWTVWMDTISEGRYADTNKMFEPPQEFSFRVTEQDSTKWAEIICLKLLGS